MKIEEAHTGMCVHVDIRIREDMRSFVGVVEAISPTGVATIRPQTWEPWMRVFRMSHEPENCLKIHCKYMTIKAVAGAEELKNPVLNGV